MTVLVLFALFVFVLIPALIAQPFMHAALRRDGSWPLGAATGLGAFLVIFSLLAREIPGYALTLPAALGVCVGLSFWGTRSLLATSLGHPPMASQWRAHLIEAFRPRRDALVLAFVGGLLFFGLLWLRAHFSVLFLDSGRYGAEKMYNLQFMNAFLFADSYPPESPWFAGAPVGYYILPKAVPGLVEHVLHHAFGVRGSMAALFHASDVLFIAFGTMALASALVLVFSWSLGAVRAARGEPVHSGDDSSLVPLCLALALGSVPLLGAPARAIAQSFKGKIDLWSLTRIVPDTINEYPFWNYLWADNHSHSSALFLQIAFLTWFVAFLRARARAAYLIPAALLAVGVVLSHSGSVLIALFVCFALAVSTAIHEWRRGRLAPFLRDGLMLAALAAFLAAPDLATRGQPAVRWYFVAAKYGTGFADFLNIYSAHMILLVGSSLLARPRLEKAQVTEVFLSVLGAVILAVAGRPAWGLSFLVFNLLRIVAAGVAARTRAENGHAATIVDDSLASGAFATGAAAATFLLLFVPEILASNFDMGEKNMRYNTLFRFLFESYFLVPLCVALALGPSLVDLARHRRIAIAGGVSFLALAGVLAWTQAATARTRIAGVPAAGTLAGGLDWFAREHPADSAIVEFLVDAPGKNLRIIEECAIGPKPSAYSMLARISSLSGRPALCGWANHVLLFQKGVPHPDYRGKNTWEILLEREKWSQNIYGLRDLDEAARKGLADFGITHVVFGEREKEHHPRVTVDALAKYGTVVFKRGEYGVIELTRARP
jgi:uncharacterized membrane protein